MYNYKISLQLLVLRPRLYCKVGTGDCRPRTRQYLTKHIFISLYLVQCSRWLKIQRRLCKDPYACRKMMAPVPSATYTKPSFPAAAEIFWVQQRKLERSHFVNEPRISDLSILFIYHEINRILNTIWQKSHLDVPGISFVLGWKWEYDSYFKVFDIGPVQRFCCFLGSFFNVFVCIHWSHRWWNMSTSDYKKLLADSGCLTTKSQIIESRQWQFFCRFCCCQLIIHYNCVNNMINLDFWS